MNFTAPQKQGNLHVILKEQFGVGVITGCDSPKGASCDNVGPYILGSSRGFYLVHI